MIENDHTGKPRPAMRVMFAPAPSAIGEVLSGDSSLHSSERNGVNLTMRVGVAITFFVLAALAGHAEGEWSAYLGFLGLALALTAGMFYATRLDATVTFVGKDGLASIRRVSVFGGSRGPTTTTLMRFDHADCLRVAATSNVGLPLLMVTGVTGSTFEFRWSDRGDIPLFTVKADNAPRPVAHSALNFARAAEAAWTVVRRARYDAELERDGSIGFPLLVGRSIRLGDGFIELRGFQGDPLRLTRDEVDHITLKDNVFRVVHVDSAWWGKGKFSFKYGDVGNAQLLVTYLKKLMSKDQAAAS